MKKVVLIIILFFSIIFISGCAEKECETATDCADKTCFDVECKNNNCVYSPISNCCGNEKCEVGETYPECVADCPDCDDKNNCTIDEYGYHEQKCVNTPILDVVCCGNTLCELGENYSTCTRDCPDCDDDDKCTKDSYDYHKQKCINEVIIPCCGNEICDEDAETFSNCATDCPDCDDDNGCTEDSYDYHEQKCTYDVIIPCCGNGICDEGAEEYSNCSDDCPNCDDNDKLTGDSFNYATQKCEYVTYYFFEDFDEGDSWTLNPKSYDPRWAVVFLEDETNGMLTKVDDATYAYTSFGDQTWTDYKFRLKVKLEQGFVEINIRMSGEEGNYAVSIFEDKLILGKDVEPRIDFEAKDYSFDSDQFYDIRIEVKDNNIKVYVDEELQIDYTDTDNPILAGHMGLYISDKAYFDYVIVEAP